MQHLCMCPPLDSAHNKRSICVLGTEPPDLESIWYSLYGLEEFHLGLLAVVDKEADSNTLLGLIYDWHTPPKPFLEESA